ncbi:hypothetical protein KCP75_01665 [Salmonella enterica subsp. enterica]|nr:hypothetical protein KCP75_01665 [Salmonella enterica subsp. enterica]
MPDEGTLGTLQSCEDRHNAVRVNWTDLIMAAGVHTELVEDAVAIGHYGRNLVKWMRLAYRSRAGAPRAGLWLIKTGCWKQTVDFSVGAEGLRHVR